MRGIFATISVIASLVISPALSQAPDYCSVALTEKAYDVSASSVASTLMFARRDELCTREYTDEGAATSAARSAGFNLGYSGFTVGGSGGKQSSTGRWNISETTFCTASAEDLKTTFAGDFQSQVASIAVKAWSDCVENSNLNALFVEYEKTPDGMAFFGTLKTTASTGALQRSITGIAALGEAKSTIQCNIGGQVLSATAPLERPIEVPTTGTAIGCEKQGEGGAYIAFQTSQGTTDFITLPSQKSIEKQAWDGLSAQLSDMDIKFARSISDIQSTIATGAVTQGDGVRGFDRGHLKEDQFPLVYDGLQNKAQDIASCPAGQMVVGIRVWTMQHHKPCIACMTGIQPVCGKIGL